MVRRHQECRAFLAHQHRFGAVCRRRSARERRLRYQQASSLVLATHLLTGTSVLEKHLIITNSESSYDSSITHKLLKQPYSCQNPVTNWSFCSPLSFHFGIHDCRTTAYKLSAYRIDFLDRY
ncbi:hypothetical protein TcasGA2_TC013618 [Tribolium castaneum]|uniref:Uncharacterized protein n=1 Tax=Tribolium castaneum TaxID=7070 RepID=D6W6Y8_TRICA|nr:hypothetical protein TcasGA2_TC013618 [Tribolium castaneum]